VNATPRGRRLWLDQSLMPGLAQSILTDGVLQNLLVRPEGEDKHPLPHDVTPHPPQI
jgi:hypothetical protein